MSKLVRSDFTRELGREFRRLDTVARFLEGAHTCVAVAFFNNKLYISSNELVHNGCGSLSAKDLERNFKSFSSITSNSISLGHVYDKMFVPYSIKKAKDTKKIHLYGESLGNWVYQLPKELKEEGKRNVQELFKAPGTQTSYKSAVDYFVSNLEKSTFSSALSKKEQNDLMLIRDILQSVHSRLIQDEKKISQILFMDDYKDLRNSLLGEPELVYPTRPSESGKKHHAEMNIAEFFINQELAKEFYIGISKLSCFGCHIDLEVVNGTEQALIKYRGTHAVDYQETRMPSKWTEESSKKYSSFVGISRASNKSLLFSEVSDSDGECEKLKLTGESSLDRSDHDGE